MGEYYLDLLIKAVILTYLVWGFAFSIHALLIMCRTKSAILWARRWYSPKIFYLESIIFYPMIFLTYLLFEMLPLLFGFNRDPFRFDIDNLVNRAFYDEI